MKKILFLGILGASLFVILKVSESIYLPALCLFLYVTFTLFCLLVQSIATPHLGLLGEENKVRPSHSFCYSFSSCDVLYVSCNSIMSNFFVLKYWNILFLLFLFCRPLTLSETICRFSISRTILTNLRTTDFWRILMCEEKLHANEALPNYAITTFKITWVAFNFMSLNPTVLLQLMQVEKLI